MKEVIIAFLIALVAGAFINGFAAGGSSAVAPQPAMVEGSSVSSSGVAIPEVSDATFDQEVLHSSTPVLVDFYMQTCAPCKEMEPVIQQVASDFGDKIKVVRLDVDSNPRVTAQYSVNTMPTFIVFKNGERGEAYTGIVPRDILAQTMNKALQ
jgi:thioredoxin 1